MHIADAGQDLALRSFELPERPTLHPQAQFDHDARQFSKFFAIRNAPIFGVETVAEDIVTRRLRRELLP
jgi:hypothetical protein